MTQKSNPRLYSSIIKSAAGRRGFDYCGIAKAERLDDDARRLEKWLTNGMHGKMQYMENHFELRIDPSKLVPGAQSVITLMVNYYPEQRQCKDAPQISKYAYGHDYHEVIRNMLNGMLEDLRSEIGEINGRGFVDSAPVLERTWAQRSGLGWIGKNGNLINRGQGSFFFIATLITDVVTEPDTGFALDYCGTCRRCLDACPTEAILPNKVVDGSKCISYFTIELKDMLLPDDMKGRFDNWMFGCDTCQDVCPWNRFSKPHQQHQLQAIPELLNMRTGDWEALTEDSFKHLFGKTALKRTKWAGIQRNLQFVKG